MNSQVLKILIDNKSKAAFGVRLRKGDHVYTVLARKEVILSAGTLNSAQLLMLSGNRDNASMPRIAINSLFLLCQVLVQVITSQITVFLFTETSQSAITSKIITERAP